MEREILKLNTAWGGKGCGLLDSHMPDERAIRHEHAEAIKCKAKISRLVVWPHVASSAANQLHVKNLAVIGIFQTTDHR